MGQLIPWTKQYEINIPKIDEEHRELFRMFNELMDAVWDGKGKDSIKQLLDFTANYAVTHFSTEEKYMKQYDYPGYLDHKKLHDDFTDDMVKFLRKYETGEVSTEMVVSVISSLGTWTREHIRATDQYLGKFLSVAIGA